MASPTGAKPTIEIDIWSDVACPWCWVGKRHLETALAQYAGTTSIRWRAFELNPSAATSTSSDVNYVERLATKYMVSHAEAQAMIDRMSSVGRENGLEFRFDRIIPGNTFDAHRLLTWANLFGLQDALKERLFVAYMRDGLAIDDRAVLATLAGDVGLDAIAAQATLASDDYRNEVREQEALAREMGVTGVPFFLINQRVALRGAQPADVLLQAMQYAENLDAESSTADSCGPDGCAV